MIVPVSELRGRQLKREFTGSKIKRLKKNMRKNGFDENYPIDIAEAGGRKVIIDGHHRARAAGAAGIKDVPARIYPVTPEQASILLQEAAEAAEDLGIPF
jgi:ParB-like chromosome segregation protein Spo0J